MTRVFDCRLIFDRPAAGPRNMAVDEALLIDAAENEIATLRFYTWTEPTLSLGYFQRYADRHQHAASRDSAVVRRQTGGGAILHDHELTYSIALPPRHPFARQNEKLYHAVHQVFIDALQTNVSSSSASPGWRLNTRDQAPMSTPVEPFLCFERRAPGDVILTLSQNTFPAPWKILGSAQRRYRGAVLQHGSLLIARSAAAPELPGFCDLAGLTVAADDVARRVCKPLEKALNLRLHETTFPAKLESIAAELTNKKYGSPAWTNRR